MTQILQWFAMGGYAFYIWPAYGLVFIVLLLNILVAKSQGLRIRKKLQQRAKR